jgi:hypothetical protein
MPARLRDRVSALQPACATQRARAWWESAGFQAGFVAPSWFRQNDVIPSRPPAGNASRWAVAIESNQ